MSFENEIPEFAMLPAKNPDEQITIPPQEAVERDLVSVTRLMDNDQIIFSIEEDVLVPDTHPDMKEILMIDGNVVLDEHEIEAEKERKPEACGSVELQVLYLPEKSDENQMPVDIKTRIRFRQPVGEEKGGRSILWLDASVQSVDTMIINERKYRVRMTVSISVSKFELWEKELFKSIKDEEMEYLKENVEICDASNRVKDVLEISEELGQAEELCPVKILRQDIRVMENYRQAASEKVVINGFLLVNVLYCGYSADDETEAHVLRQLQEKVEFTQFIPLQNHGQWQASRAVYDVSGLKVKITEDEAGMSPFVLEGSLISRVALIKTVEKEMVVDAYHRKKDFICDYEMVSNPVHGGTTSGETAVREIISFDDESASVDGAVYTCCNLTGVSCSSEGGKIVAEGNVNAKVMCRKSEGGYFVGSKDVPFRCVLASGQVGEHGAVKVTAAVKEIWAEKINGRQVEVNVSLSVQATLIKNENISVVKKPAFRDCGVKESTSPVIIYVSREGDTVWSIAKRFKTEKLSIYKNNNVDNDEISAGKKLLIMR